MSKQCQVTIDSQQLNTILSALRHFQRTAISPTVNAQSPSPTPEIAHFSLCGSLLDENGIDENGIDQLCEQINLCSVEI